MRDDEPAAKTMTGPLSVFGAVCVLAAVGFVVYPNLRHDVPAPVAPLEVAPAVATPSPAPAAAVPPAPVDDTAQRLLADARAQRATLTLAEARASVQIIMYSTSWCGYCRAARAWLGSQNIAYVDHDIEHDPVAGAHVRTIAPGGGVPVFEIDGVVLHGFSAGTLGQRIAEAAARRADAVR